MLLNVLPYESLQNSEGTELSAKCSKLRAHTHTSKYHLIHFYFPFLSLYSCGMNICIHAVFSPFLSSHLGHTSNLSAYLALLVFCTLT